VLFGLKRFTRSWCKKNLRPIARDADTSVESWLAKTNYPQKRKDQLLKLHRDTLALPKDFQVRSVKGFLKDEAYDTFKHPRWIMSRSDYFKTQYGPITKLIEEEVYKHESFIKHVPEKMRPETIKKMLYAPGSTYLVTDYTAFESHFVPEIMEALEFELYRYMTSGLPDGAFFMSMNTDVIGKENHIVSRNMWFTVLARMSGEMSTSLGNGFSNLMLMLFTCKRAGCQHVRGVVEGDDGLFALTGKHPEAEDFAEAGFDIKLEAFTEISETSFCGMVFEATAMQQLACPYRTVANFGWASKQYQFASDATLKALARARAMSIKVQYPGCPMIAALARYGIRTTEDIDPKFMRRTLAKSRTSQYQLDKLFYLLEQESTFEEPLPATRLLFEERYGVPISTQLAFEEYLDARQEYGVIKFPEFEALFPNEYIQMWQSYVVEEPHEVNHPPIPELWYPDRIQFLKDIALKHWNQKTNKSAMGC